MPDPTKPPYRVPSMAEIRALVPCGLTVASTFSGCGGSSLGYRMAGFRVLWASEFVEAARDSYRANADPSTVLDARDIRDVQPAEVLAACGLREGELDLLDGSPPCASFSTAGNREKDWGKVKAYSDTKQRTDDLFHEYVRLLRGIRPRTFVAENVSGLVKGTAKGTFLEVLAALKASGYRVRARVLDAKWLGVPQSRQRLIFVGVREDLGLEPAFPSPLSYFYSVRDALPWLSRMIIGNEAFRPVYGSTDSPSPTIMTSPGSPDHATHGFVEGRVVHDTSGVWGAGDVTDLPCPTITVGVNALSSQHFKVSAPEPTEAELREASTEGYAIGAEMDRLAPGEQSARYFSLQRAHPERPSPCVTALANSLLQGSAGVVHPYEKRKFTIGELKRICGFPDDFVLTGTYAQQWERLGRAVPPVMMAAVARAVRDRILLPARGLPPCAG